MSSANSELYEPVFKLSGISKSFDGRPLLKNINLDFYPGQICSILGENGAGKSTLIKIMAGKMCIIDRANIVTYSRGTAVFAFLHPRA